MANQEPLALLRSGVEKWNAFREENPDLRPDLAGVDLAGCDLRGATLTNAGLGRRDHILVDVGCLRRTRRDEELKHHRQDMPERTPG